jgi:hypothetical protein
VEISLEYGLKISLAILRIRISVQGMVFERILIDNNTKMVIEQQGA